MTCGEALRTQAYLDGALAGAAIAEAERHIEGCAECRQLSAEVAQLSDAMRKGVTQYRAPQALRARIGAALDAEDSKSIVPFRRWSFWFGAASGAGVSALAASVAMLVLLPPSAATLAQAITDDHTRALASGHLIEIASSSHHVVKPWFAGRVDVSPPAADFAAQGFALAGGRIDQVAGSRAAVVVYRHGRHLIDLFVWPDRGSMLPGNATRHGYRVMFWKNGDLDFAAVSDTERRELEKFVGLVRSQPE
jgi:anti-sigma factor RsiW